MSILRSLLLLFIATISGCASTGSLPGSAEEVSLHPSRFQYGYWPRYTASVTFSASSLEQALAAGRRAMADNGFKVVRDDPTAGTLMGEHGATLFYCNVMAGMYFTPKDGAVEVKIIAVGSKDIRFVELQRSPWPDRLASSLKAASITSGK